METLPQTDLSKLISARRRFLTGMGMAGAAAIAAPALSIGRAYAQTSPAASAPTATDVEILNFALNLEYLEAQFYYHAALGRALPADLLGGTGTQGGVTGGSKVTFTDSTIRAFAEELAEEEMLHVVAIRSAITAGGGKPVAQPSIDLQTSFTTLARAAGLISASQTFSPFSSETNFLLGAFIFEDVGVTAYNGAAQQVSSAVLQYTTSILAVEAYHAGAIRIKAFGNGLGSQTRKIAALRAKLAGTSGTNADDTGVVISGSEYGNNRITDRDDNAFAFVRSSAQVLNIVYGAPGANKGLFFPAGLNGGIR